MNLESMGKDLQAKHTLEYRFYSKSVSGLLKIKYEKP
jgi:hypothetical protein